MKILFPSLALFVAAGWALPVETTAQAPADQPRALGFTAAPAAIKDGDKVVIRFAVTAATDVAVWVEDARGKVVRHLAAGVLGRNAPPPLRPDSLEQSLVWDGKDDLGKPVKPRDETPAAGAGGAPSRGPSGVSSLGLKVRVAIGLRPTLDRILGNNPSDLGGVRALATGPDGRLYVFHTFASQHPNDATAACAVFDRQGKYLRTILPFPADLPDAKLRGIRRLARPDGQKVPYVYQFETHSCLPGLGDLPNHRAVVTRDGRLAFCGIQEGPRMFAQPGEARLTVVHTDGGVPDDGVLKTLIAPLTDAAASLALSPDESTIYAAGVRAGIHPNGPSPAFICDVCDHGGDTWTHTVPLPTVYKFSW